MNTDKIKKEIELEFRYKFYHEPHFLFLHSMNIKHIFQSFERDGRFIGVLYLQWKTEPEPYFWHSEWINSPIEAIMKAQIIQSEIELFDEDKIVFANLNHIQKKVQDKYDMVRKQNPFNITLN